MYFVRKQFQAGIIVLKYLKTDEMLEVVLTKLLPKEKIEFCIDGVVVRDS